MEDNLNSNTAKHKGGRPTKKLKRTQLLGVKCTLAEKRLIQIKATQAQVTVSEYLRELGTKGKIDSRNKALPKEVLQLTASLNHISGLLNQIAKKLNSLVPLSGLDLDALELLCRELKDAATTIKTFVQ